MKYAALIIAVICCGEPEKPNPTPIVVIVEHPPPDLCIRRRECCWPVPISPGLICAECCDD